MTSCEFIDILRMSQGMWREMRIWWLPGEWQLCLGLEFTSINKETK
jgi:hypothetical protein